MTFSEDSLYRCCGSSAWVRKMMSRSPFADEDALLEAADEVWYSVARDDWLEAFAQHAKIGDRAGSKWSSEEQRGMDEASVQTASEMLGLNRRYQEKFGYIFIVCATGKTADQMRELLVKRLQNDPADEISIAAREQAEITKIRLRKLLAE